MLIGSYDAETNEQIVREATKEEIEEREAQIALRQQEKEAIIAMNADLNGEKSAAKAALLQRLGITPEEAALLLG
jgi:hypothetical protein